MVLFFLKGWCQGPRAVARAQVCLLCLLLYTYPLLLLYMRPHYLYYCYICVLTTCSSAVLAIYISVRLSLLARHAACATASLLLHSLLLPSYYCLFKVLLDQDAASRGALSTAVCVSILLCIYVLIVLCATVCVLSVSVSTDTEVYKARTQVAQGLIH